MCKTVNACHDTWYSLFKENAKKSIVDYKTHNLREKGYVKTQYKKAPYKWHSFNPDTYNIIKAMLRCVKCSSSRFTYEDGIFPCTFLFDEVKIIYSYRKNIEYRWFCHVNILSNLDKRIIKGVNDFQRKHEVTGIALQIASYY